tara:strand:- start:1180 stop:1503 length:324 start_codon:yes stop_codon:yes gene_type:complete
MTEAVENTHLTVNTPNISAEVVDFAKKVAQLAVDAGLREINMDVRLDTGLGTKYWEDHELKQNTHTKMTIRMTTKDERCRPYYQLYIDVNSNSSVDVDWEPNNDSDD